jgi:hypothetical protein
MKLVRLIKMVLNETYSIVLVGKRVSDIFHFTKSFKERNALRIFLNRTEGYAVRKVHVNQDGLKLNGTHKLLNYAEKQAACSSSPVTGLE